MTTFPFAGRGRVVVIQDRATRSKEREWLPAPPRRVRRARCRRIRPLSPGRRRTGGRARRTRRAPARLRVETQLGFKMVKWVRAIEFVADYRHIGQGQGGWREDQQYYANAAGI